MTKPNTGNSYQAYLIRCILIKAARPGIAPVWSFVLRQVSDEPREKGFSEFQQLVDFLKVELHITQDI